MESYGEWRVTVHEVIFGELRFHDTCLHHLTIRIISKTNFGELNINGNSPNCSVVQLSKLISR